MPNTKPVTALQNYSEVLNEVKNGAPVFLTEGGHESYVIMTAQQYKEWARNKLMYELEKVERSALEKGWYTYEEAMKELRARIMASDDQ